MKERKCFCGIRKRNRSFPGRVKCREQIYEQGNDRYVCSTLIGYVEAERSGEQCPSHIGERDEKQGSPPECVNATNGGPGKPKRGQHYPVTDTLMPARSYTKLMSPKPQEAHRAVRSLAFASLKSVDE